MSKIVKISLLSLVSIAVLVGCSNSDNATPSTCQDGMYCYKNINFGKSKGADFEQGVRDGCHTGEGNFKKDYSKSSTSKIYEDGWILGRSKCKQILPNEGTIQEEKDSKIRAEYEIEQLKLKSSQNSDSEEGVVNSLVNNNSNDNSSAQDIEY